MLPPADPAPSSTEGMTKGVCGVARRHPWPYPYRPGCRVLPSPPATRAPHPACLTQRTMTDSHIRMLAKRPKIVAFVVEQRSSCIEVLKRPSVCLTNPEKRQMGEIRTRKQEKEVGIESRLSRRTPPATARVTKIFVMASRESVASGVSVPRPPGRELQRTGCAPETVARAHGGRQAGASCSVECAG